MSLIIRARRFATKAHAGQTRKYTGESYIWHPVAVAGLVAMTDDASPAIVVAALLHDVVEDCAVTLGEIRSEFGPIITDLVNAVTDQSRPSDGNRAVRKAIDREHIAKASPSAKTIKLADLIDNAASITAHDPDFAQVYMREKAALLDVLSVGDPWLFAWATEIVRTWEDAQLQSALAKGDTR